MMLGLGSDVCDRMILLRDSDRERTISLLHAKSLVCSSFIHRDDAPFISCTAFANGMVALNDNRMCT